MTPVACPLNELGHLVTACARHLGSARFCRDPFVRAARPGIWGNMAAMTRTLSRSARSACAVVLVLGAASGLAACGADREDRAAVAAAKCSLPVAEKAGFPQDALPQKEAVDVETLTDGRYRVTGRSTILSEVTNAVGFLCEVAPDRSDKLRGFKVTRLEVTPIPDGAEEPTSAGVTLPYTGSGEPAPPGQPCDGATVFKTLEELDAATETPMYAPVGTTPSKVWSCGGDPYLGYGSLEVNFHPGWDDINPDTKWAGMVKQSGGRVETILGRPAWVRPADRQGTWPVVEVIVNGTLVTVLGAPGVSTQEVVALAKSIPAPES